MGAYNKFFIALAMAGAEYIRARYGVDLGLDEATVSGLVGALTALLVWAIPNKGA